MGTEGRRAHARLCLAWGERRREHGVVMFITVLLLAMMGGLGLAALDAATRDRDAAGHYNREAAAFYSAEAGVAHARAIVRRLASHPDDKPAFPTEAAPQTMGDTALYPNGAGATGGNALPIYYGDPAEAFPIRCDDGTGNPDLGGQYTEGMNLQEKGPKTLKSYWTINVVGRTPDGAMARIEAKEAKGIYGLGGY